MVRKLILAGALLAFVAGPAAAQMALSPFKEPDKRRMTPEEIEKKKAADAAYKAALDKVPDKKSAADPWGSVREAPSGGTATTAKDATKTSATKTSAKDATKTKPQQ
jgi:hypothetical protein